MWFAIVNAWLLDEATSFPFHWGLLLLLGVAFMPTLFFANSRKVPFAVWECYVGIIVWASYIGIAIAIALLAWKFIKQ